MGAKGIILGENTTEAVVRLIVALVLGTAVGGGTATKLIGVSPEQVIQLIHNEARPIAREEAITVITAQARPIAREEAKDAVQAESQLNAARLEAIKTQITNNTKTIGEVKDDVGEVNKKIDRILERLPLAGRDR